MGRSAKVFIIILNWNRPEDTIECLHSVFGLEYPNFEVVVVDNGSSDRSASMIREQFPSLKLIEEKENLGFTGGNNVGLRQGMDAGADYMWLLNNDTVVDKGSLAELVREAEAFEDVALVSPYIYFYHAREKAQYRGKYVDWEGLSIKDVEEEGLLKDEKFQKRISVWGTAMLVSRRAIETLGFLDEKYFAYFEDEEYSMRALRAGFRNLVVSSSHVYHKDSQSTGGYLSPMQAFLRSRNLYFLWMDKLRGWDRVRYMGKFLDHVINYAASLQERGRIDSADASLDGLWSAIKRRGGNRELGDNIPPSFAFLFKKVIFRNPYFWGCLVRGDFREIARKLISGKSVEKGNG